jgi:lipopolysaccharide/colanic/teichoic acid biosynthesis glycosyltransferase
VHLAQADLAQVPLAQANQSPADLSDIDFDRYYREIVLPDKLNMNLRYLDRISLSHDLWLLFRTTVAIFTPRLYAIHEDHSPR